MYHLSSITLQFPSVLHNSSRIFQFILVAAFLITSIPIVSSHNRFKCRFKVDDKLTAIKEVNAGLETLVL